MPELQVPEEVACSVKKFEAALSALETALEPIAELTPRQVDAQLAPLQRAQFHVTVAEAINVLFQMYLKTQGVSPEEHPVAKEVERLKLYRRKVNKAVFEANGLSERAMTVNISAATRFIDAAIPDLSQEQKKQIQEVGRRAQEASKADEGRGSLVKQRPPQAQAQPPRSAATSSRDVGAASSGEEPEEAFAPATAAPKRTAERPAPTSGSGKKHKAKKYPLGNVVAQADAFLRAVGQELAGEALAEGGKGAGEKGAEAGLGMKQVAQERPGVKGLAMDEVSEGFQEDSPQNQALEDL
eukprot:jgi/Mesvir1/23505/Mv22347-RA.1